MGRRRWSSFAGKFPNPRPLTVLQAGVGDDATGLLVRLFGLDGKPSLDRELRPDVVTHEDTGVEEVHTQQYRPWLAAECARHGIPFVTVASVTCNLPSQ